jgi:hypothetical protein
MRAWVRGISATLGAGALAAGGVAVYVTDNGTGSAALVAAGVALGALALFGDRIASVGVAGTQISLVQASTQLQAEADEADAAGNHVAADRLRAQAAQLLALARPAAERYELLRDQPSGRERTAGMTALVQEARSAARSDQWDSESVRQLFQTSRDGMRLYALGLMEGDPSLIDLLSVIDAIDASRSAFEQYHALLVARSATRSALDPQTAGMLRDALTRALEGRRTGEDRRQLAREALVELDLRRWCGSKRWASTQPALLLS